jgi:hypothetical protein
MDMLTESREAMRFLKPEQILAIASLSSPHHEANPFLKPSLSEASLSEAKSF